MGLNRRRLPKRLDAWYWRARYWWMDTEAGTTATVFAFVLAVLVVVIQTTRMTFASLLPPPPGEPTKAVAWWVVQLIIAVVAAILSFVLRPKMPKNPEPEQKGPQVEDGVTFDNFYGTHWHEDEGMPAWKVVDKKKIKSKGGKK